MRLKLKGKIGITLLVVCLVFSSLSLSAYSGISAEAASITDNEVFLKQTQSGRCTLSSVAMMLRRKALLDGNGNWSSITEETLLSTAWVMNQGLRWSFSYAGMSVNCGSFSGNAQNKKEQLTSLLNQHPEGVVIYMYGGGNYTHAVLATSYENGTVYVADPAGYLPKGIIPMTSAYLSGSTQDERIGNLKMYWYVSNGSCNLATPAPAPAIHTHSWSYKNDSTHPHSQYRICSCGAKEYTSARFNVPSCAQCRPLGNVKLTRSFNKVSGNADFRRNNVSNATSYTLTLYKDGVQYGSYNMSSLTSYSVTGLSAGNYSATLTARNDNTGETRSGSCSNFKIVNTYSVNYDANGGSGAPSGQSKIQNEALTLSSSKPSKPHYVFKGWASSRTADVPQYQPGGFYSKNSKIILYAVWEPETYNVKFDLNGGKGECADRTITYGDTAKMPNSAVKDGFYLKGWSAQKNASNPDYKLGIDYKIDSNLTLYAVWGNSTWTDEVASSFAGGDGTEQNPYLISNASELAYLAQLVNSQSAAPEYKYYKLTDNINLGYSEWIPIGLGGNENQYFCGQFDGNGYTISDLYISGVNENNIGLFGIVKSSIFKDLTLTGAIEGIKTTSSALNIGGIAGKTQNTNFANCNTAYFSISNLNVGTSDFSCVGSICGYADGGIIKTSTANECYINLKEGQFYSGIIAGKSSADISECMVKATESGLFGTSVNVGTYYIGGLCGSLTGTASKSSVTAPYFANNLQNPKSAFIGGFCGYTDNTVSVCSVQFLNGISKTIDGAEYKSSIYVSGSGDAQIGGFTGLQGKYSRISDCKYNGQSISGISTNNSSSVSGLSAKVPTIYTDSLYLNGAQHKLSYSSMIKREGYKATWYTDRDKTVPYDFNSTVSTDMDLYAKWEKGEDQYYWDGTSKEPEYNPETKTYYITNSEELAWVSDVTNGTITNGNNFPEDKSFLGYTVELTSDIWLSKGEAMEFSWKPIRTFNGHLNGNSYTIYNLQFSEPQNDWGFISVVGENALIENLNMKRRFHSSLTGMGGNKYFQMTTKYNNSNIGIIAGLNKGIIKSCNVFGGGAFYMYLSGDSIRVGAISGTNYGTIEECINKGVDIKLDCNNGSVGGISGYNCGKIINCYSDCEISSKNQATIGSICGANHDGGIVTYCYSAGHIDVTSGCLFAGGICGSVYNASLSKCYTDVTVYPTNLSNANLIAGVIDGAVVSYCYASTYNTGDTLRRVGSTSTTNNVQKINLQYILNFPGIYADTWKVDSEINNGKPILIVLEDTYKSYKISKVDIEVFPVLRSISNIDGIIYGESSSTPYASGLAVECSGSHREIKSSISIVDKIDAKNTSGGKAYKGYLLGIGKNVNSSYYDSDVELSKNSSNDIINTAGTARSSRLIKIPSFLKNQLGLNEYKSVENLNNDETAVWVIRDGELPELYYNCLRDITISNDIENGTVTADKTQAIDGEAVTLSVKPNDGYELNTVYVNGKEIAGTSFEMSGNADIYATFKPVTPEYSVKVEANSNATASLTKNDESSVMLLSAADTTQLTAKDGEEVLVNTAAAQDYTVDSVYVNGEEIAANSFIVTDDSTVTLAVQSLSTDIKAVTNDAAEIGPYFATLSGEVQDDNGNVKYIRYWKADEPETVFVTEPGTESGIYSATVMLDSDTEYKYQMLENGEIKSFKTLSSDDGAYQENTVLTETVCTSKNGVHTFDITLKKDIGAKMVMLALYDSADKLLCVKNLTFDESKLKLEIDAPTCSTAKIFVWDKTITPQSVSEVIKVKNN